MKKRIKHLLFRQDRMAFQYAVPIAVISLLLVSVLAALLMNTMGLDRQLQENTERYADDVSGQLAKNISSRMSLRETYLRSLADTISRIPKSVLTGEILERKAEYLEMEEIFIVGADGAVLRGRSGQERPELEAYLAERPEMFEESQIFYTDHNEVFFASPILWKGSGERGILVGVRSNAVLQQMLQDVDFKDQGLCCIVDKGGTVVVSATDEAPFMALKDIFSEDATAEDKAEASQVLEDLEAHRSGVAKFSDVGGEPVILGYDFLGINDWMLLTLLPSDLFSRGTALYLLRYVVIIGAMLLIMLLLFGYIRWTYRRSYREIQNAALADPLTGGRNRAAFQMEGENLLREHMRRAYAIAYLNIRNFKWVNERFGSKAGDRLLRQVYRLLQECLQEGELICRTAGDHFCLLLECGSEEEVRRRLAAMFGRLDEQMPGEFSIGSSRIASGAYLIRDRETDFTVLIDRAKAAGGHLQNETCRFYDDAFGKQVKRQQSLDDSFPRAIEKHEFQLYIQPKVCPGRNEINSGEVLVRWQHPEYGLIFPGDFIPLFERNGKICDLDFYLFEETCRLLRGWLDEGRAVPLSVNLSRAHLMSSDLSFLDRFKAMKEQYGIPDGLIELELTESLMLKRREIHLVMAMVDRIREMGFLCSIDDFGFGYSSLTMLKDLNVTTVKLDRQFFQDESDKSWVVVRQIIQLAHNLGMAVVAEGIENQDQVEKLRQCGCDLIQGYVCAKPMPVSDFERWPDTGRA